MDASKNYYAILNVAETADEENIRAAYRTLAKRYHPDSTRAGARSSEKFRSIQEAYDVLSNSEIRRQYDERRGQRKERSNPFGDTVNSTTIDLRRWALIAEYHPEIAILDERLRRLSVTLSEEYRLKMVKEKAFTDSESIFNTMRERFLRRWFGKNSAIQDFGEWCIVERHTDAAKELNKVMEALGGNADSDSVIRNVCSKNGLCYEPASTSTLREDKNLSSRSEELMLLATIFFICLVLVALVKMASGQ
jgi:hypothetical protein